MTPSKQGSCCATCAITRRHRATVSNSPSASKSTHPNCLLPLANAALLDRTLEFLTQNHAKEIFILCTKDHVQKIEKHLGKRSRIEGTPDDARIRLLQGPANMDTVGDALQFVEEERVINHDFILCTADIVSNVDLSGAILKHKQRRKKDKLCVAAMFRERRERRKEGKFGDSELMLGLTRTKTKSSSSTKEQNQEHTTTNTSITTNDEDEYKIVAFKESKGGVTKSAGGQLNIDAARQTRRREVETNARDLCVYICSPEVLMLFTDNFDYQSIRKDFVCGILDEANEQSVARTLYRFR